VAQKTVKSLNTREYDLLIEVLGEHRLRAKMSAYALAKELGEDPSYIYKVEGKDRRLDVVEFASLARAMNCDPRELFSEWYERILHLETSGKS
jgi:transcriptional regulator with XRE-family HTH domain